MAPPRCFSDKCKCISAVTLVTLCILVLISGGVLYMLGYKEINGKEISGDPYLTELQVDYESFSFYVLLSTGACAAVLFFGLIAAQCKRPYTSVIYILIVLLAGGLML